jgi:hypothetical protein
MSKKIKKIDEFFDDSRLNFKIDTREITDEEEKERRDYNNRMTEENIKDFPKRTTPNLTIEEYREIILSLEVIDNFKYSQEERDELDNDCMEMYGEPFFKKDNIDNE